MVDEAVVAADFVAVVVVVSVAEEDLVAAAAVIEVVAEEVDSTVAVAEEADLDDNNDCDIYRYHVSTKYVFINYIFQKYAPFSNLFLKFLVRRRKKMDRC